MKNSKTLSLFLSILIGLLQFVFITNVSSRDGFPGIVYSGSITVTNVDPNDTFVACGITLGNTYTSDFENYLSTNGYTTNQFIQLVNNSLNTSTAKNLINGYPAYLTSIGSYDSNCLSMTTSGTTATITTIPMGETLIIVPNATTNNYTAMMAEIGVDDYGMPIDATIVANIITPLNDTGFLNISDVKSGDSFVAYKILNTYYDSSSNTVSYDFTSEFKTFLNNSNDYQNLSVNDYLALTSGDILSGSTQTTSTLDVLASAYTNYIKENSINGTSMTTIGTEAVAELEVGSYLVLPSVTSSIYAVMVGNIALTESNGQWTVPNMTIVAKASDAYINKYVDSIGTTSASHDIGEEYTYHLVIPVLRYPTNAINEYFYIEDHFDYGIDLGDYNALLNPYGFIRIYDGNTELTVDADGYILDSSNNQVGRVGVTPRTSPTALPSPSGIILEIEFYDFDYVLSNTVTVSYRAKLNEYANIGSTGNTNTVTLTYVNEPYWGGTTTTTSSSTVYTYTLNVKKEDATTHAGLSGVVFDVYSDSALTNKVGSITTDQNGNGSLVGIASGTYYLKEVRAYTGYKLLSSAVSVTVNNSNNSITISNSKMSNLPFTGSMGTIIYTIIGFVFIIVVTFIYIIYKKKTIKKNEI